MIPVEAVEAAAKAYQDLQARRGHPSWDELGRFGVSGQRLRLDDMAAALEAALPILLSHEREQTRLAHLDAIVNRETKRDELAAEYRRGYRDGLVDRKEVTATTREWEPGDPLE